MEKWRFHFSTTAFEDLRYQGISRHEEFYAKNNDEAKTKVLELTKSLISRLRRRDLFIFIFAMPFLNKEEKVLNGERMIRIKDKFLNKRILHISNPEVALVQGYGPKALEEISS